MKFIREIMGKKERCMEKIEKYKNEKKHIACRYFLMINKLKGLEMIIDK
jgi:hypothetical protein